MSLQTRLGALITAIGADIKALQCPRVTTLPLSPVDGQQVYYVADSAKNVLWRLRYNATALKWEFVGGQPLTHILNEGGTVRTTTVANTTNNYANLSANAAGDGPIIASVPLTGDYGIEFGYAAGWNTVSGAFAMMSVMLGSGTNLAATMDLRRIENSSGTLNSPQAGSNYIEAALTAGDQVLCRYAQSGGGSASWRYQRYLRVTPLRIQPLAV